MRKDRVKKQKTDEDKVAEGEEDEAPPKKQIQVHKFQASWNKGDLLLILCETQMAMDFECTKIGDYRFSTSLEKIFTNEFVDHICLETKTYAVNKSNGTFVLEPGKFRIFCHSFAEWGRVSSHSYFPEDGCIGNWKMSTMKPYIHL